MPKRPVPVEVLCRRDGFVIYHGMTTDFKSHPNGVSTFTDIKSRTKRTYAAECYKYLDATWEASRFRPEVKK